MGGQASKTTHNLKGKEGYRPKRILSGKWKGRVFKTDQETPCRHTLSIHKTRMFDWVQSIIRGSVCLDLFAGSGALGLEALSRGAAFVRFVEKFAPQAKAIRHLLIQWEASEISEVRTGDALKMLRGKVDRTFDLVLLDPPFDQNFWEETEGLLLSKGWIRPGGYLIREIPAGYPHVYLKEPWELLREKKAESLSVQWYKANLE